MSAPRNGKRNGHAPQPPAPAHFGDRPVIGRPSRISPAIIAAIAQAVSQGMPYTRAAILCDIPEYTAKDWYQKGLEGNNRFSPFTAAVQKAWAADEQRRLNLISSVGNGGAVVHEKTTTMPDGTVIREVKRAAPQWAAHAWVLERTRRETYALQVRMHQELDVSPVLAALMQQWQDWRDAPTEARGALPSMPPAYDAEAELVMEANEPGEEEDFTSLDALNGHDDGDGED